MDNIAKTLYIPLYGKAMVSRKGILLKDSKAESIWEQNRLPLGRKSRSRWLAYFMSIRAAVFDAWTREQIAMPDSLVLHLGCGLDNRIGRVGHEASIWIDADQKEVIAERRKYYSETSAYRMLAIDAKETDWITDLPDASHLILVMEGISMYLNHEELQHLFECIDKKYDSIAILMDCYTEFGARMSLRHNPVNEVGVSQTYGTDNPTSIETTGIKYLQECEMTPLNYIDELPKGERWIFRHIFAGRFAKQLYRMYEYRKHEKPLPEQ